MRAQLLFAFRLGDQVGWELDFFSAPCDVKPKERIEFGRKMEEQDTHGLDARGLDSSNPRFGCRFHHQIKD